MLKNVSKIASELSRAESIPHTRQALRQWKDAGTHRSNLNRTLRTAFAPHMPFPQAHTDIPAPSDLKILEPRADDTELSVGDILGFLGKPSVWDKNYSRVLHTWAPSDNTFGKNYESSVKVHDPTPLQSFLQKYEDRSNAEKSQMSEEDQGTRSEADKTKEGVPTDEDLKGLATQLERQISIRLDNKAEDSRASTEL